MHFCERSANYNRAMNALLETRESSANSVVQRDLTPLDQTRFAFISNAHDPATLAYCLSLAMQNMAVYLQARGRDFDVVRWRETALRANFFLIRDAIDPAQSRIGFLSLREEPDCPNTTHIGDIQLEPRAQNRGAGSAALRFSEARARAEGKNELTLNVFRDNPAIGLYERFGFLTIDYGFDKYKMRKVLA
ncbi:MAG: GNAT family N-acetyltransferase [Betaproteobacteria bacterium]|nr:MAG: GNAT family N-acetyltransferase [Betaproteobacteria bacterium]